MRWRYCIAILTVLQEATAHMSRLFKPDESNARDSITTAFSQHPHTAILV